MNDISSKQALGFVFPGQGSQSIGMMGALAAEYPQVRARYATASEVLGFDLWRLVEQGPEEELNLTQNTQPALLAASVATWDIWCAEGGPRPALMAGHSFGEYSALVCAGALDFATAVALVAERGRLMQSAVPAGEGSMAAILGLDLESVQAICGEASSTDGVCTCANLNAPGQGVIAGATAAVDRACALAKARGAKKAIKLAVSVPAHCALMQPAADGLATRLAEVEFSAPGVKVLHNADVENHTDGATIRAALVAQMCRPVRWVETIERFAQEGVTHIAECGPGKVLGALIKRIDKNVENVALGDPAALREFATLARNELS